MIKFILILSSLLFSQYSYNIHPDGFLAIAKGDVAGYQSYNKFGGNFSVGTTTETVWDGGGSYSYLDSARIISIKSNDADDNSAGAGARGYTIQGLDSNWHEYSESLAASTDTIKTTKKFIRVFRVTVDSAGSTGSNEGIITASYGGTVLAQIGVGNNQTLMALFTVPDGKTAYIFYGKASATSGRSVTCDFFIRQFNRVFQLKHRFYLFENSYDFTFNIPLVAPSKSDMEVRAVSSSASTGVTAVWNMILIDN